MPPEEIIAASYSRVGESMYNPVQDHGFMYNRNLADPGGHIWEALWMDPTAIPSGDQK
jgi:predicted lactoylglutathione lyase